MRENYNQCEKKKKKKQKKGGARGEGRGVEKKAVENVLAHNRAGVTQKPCTEDGD